MVHKFKMNGYNIVLDTNSGAVHCMDDVAYDALQLYDNRRDYASVMNELCAKYSIDKVNEAISDIDELKNTNQLFTEYDYTEVLNKTKNRQPVVKALCLHIAHDCNLKCRYCFAKEGEYSGERSIMSIDVAKAAISFVQKNSGNRKNIEIDLFGGEPLMNFDVIEQLVKYANDNANGKKFRFTLTTNGILLNDKIESFVLKNMDNVVLSIDGRKAINDEMRPSSNKKSSYDIIVPKFLSIAQKREQYYVRGTFTRNNLDFANDILHLSELGFKQISVEPVVGGAESDYSLREDDVPIICDEYEKLAIHMANNPDKFNFFHFNIDLTGGPCVAKRISGCGAGTEYLAVTPEGDLYPCHQFVNDPSFKMGDVFNGLDKPEMRNSFESINVLSKSECNDCFAKFYCSGGCMANAYQFHGDINRTYEIGCSLQRKRVECALMLKVDKHVKSLK